MAQEQTTEKQFNIKSTWQEGFWTNPPPSGIFFKPCTTLKCSTLLFVLEQWDTCVQPEKMNTMHVCCGQTKSSFRGFGVYHDVQQTDVYLCTRIQNFSLTHKATLELNQTAGVPGKEFYTIYWGFLVSRVVLRLKDTLDEVIYVMTAAYPTFTSIEKCLEPVTVRWLTAAVCSWPLFFKMVIVRL